MSDELNTDNSVDTVETLHDSVEQSLALPASGRVNSPTQESNQDSVADTEVVETEQTETKDSFLDRMKDKFFGKKEEVKVETGTTQKKELEENISDNFTKAALKAGWKEKDVLEFAENYTNAELEQLIPALMTEQESDDDPEKTSSAVVIPEIKQETLTPFIEQLEKKLEAKYQEKIKGLEDRFSAIEKDRSVRDSQSVQRTVDDFFDKATEQFPVFGKTKDMLKFPDGTPQAGAYVPVGDAFESRKEVLKAAQAFTQMGLSVGDSLNEALSWYKGKHMEKDVRSKVLKELKSNEKRLSPKRSEHAVPKKFASAQEQKQAVIDDLARRAGIV